MNSTKKLGIWMDHASAQLMEFNGGPINTNTISSSFTSQEKSQSLGKSEHVMHNQEQGMHKEYYKKLGEAILQYENVVIFGPTNAKAELANGLKADHRFSNIQIEVKPADQMTEPQKQAFVRDFFNTDKQDKQ
jgi:hypothetical protein